MKKLLALLLAASLTLCMTACERRERQTPGLSQSSEADEPVYGDDDSDTGPVADDTSKRDPVAEADAREAELAVRDCMAALKTGTQENIDRHIDYDAFLGLEEGQRDDNLRSLLKRMDYEITDTEVDGEIATVTAMISNIDMHEVLGDYLRAAMDLEYTNGTSESPKSPEQMEVEYLQLFLEHLDSNSGSRRESTVEVAVGRVDGWWRVQPDELLRAAVFGDYFEASSTVGPNAGGGSR